MTDVNSNIETIHTEIDEIRENVNQNFSTAADDIGNALVAKGYSIPTGTDISGIVEIINSTNVTIITSSINILSDSSYSGGWSGSTSAGTGGTTKTKTILSRTTNLIGLNSIKSITGQFKTSYYDGELSTTTFEVRCINSQGTVVKSASKQVTSSTTVNVTVDTSTITESCYIEYYMYMYRNHVDSATPDHAIDYMYCLSIIITP